MKIKEQSGLRAVLQDTPIPRMALVRQIFPRDGIGDAAAELRAKLDDEKLKGRIRPGMRVGMTGSSRQINNMALILKELAAFVAGKLSPLEMVTGTAFVQPSQPENMPPSPSSVAEYTA